MLLCELFEVKKRPKHKPKSSAVKKKLRVKQKRHRHHVRPVKRVTDEGFFGDMAAKAATWTAGKVLAKLGTGGN